MFKAVRSKWLRCWDEQGVLIPTGRNNGDVAITSNGVPKASRPCCAGRASPRRRLEQLVRVVAEAGVPGPVPSPYQSDVLTHPKSP